MWTPAMRFTQVDTSLSKDGDLILPGFANRRGLMFVSAIGGSGALSTETEGLPTLSQWPITSVAMFTLMYKDWGPMVTAPWYFRGPVGGGVIGIYEVYFV